MPRFLSWFSRFTPTRAKAVYPAPALPAFPNATVRQASSRLGVSVWFLGGAVLAAIAGRATAAVPKAELPDGLELVVAAAPPLLNYPIMGSLDDRGRLFIGDSGGLNLNKKGLEEQLPNRVLLLEDQDGDGVFDKTSVFADKMTFPQGACWLNGSLYVASPPGIWKLTDTNGDGVADQREMIVGGFEYTGNAADVHGPFLHPNGRLYWCHGRKGHKVVQRDGTVVHEGLASGVWSCKPDGSDVQWHALACSDNPVEVDFTPEGDILGTVNIYYSQPRGDTLIHWQYGGAYERPDQLNAIAGLPRTVERMPVVYNFGHVGISGCTFYRSGALNPEWKGDMLAAYFNTQKIVRLKLSPVGATYRATEHEFLKINDPDVHLTDMIEDADGSLLVFDTGGWFRLGCPSSLIEKPDLRGAIYRVRKKNARPVADAYGLKIQWDNLRPDETTKLLNDDRWMVRRKAAAVTRIGTQDHPATVAELRDASRPMTQRRALETIAKTKRIEPAQRDALLALLGGPLDPSLEHAAMYAAIATRCFDLQALERAAGPTLIRRIMLIVEQTAREPAAQDALLAMARKHVDAPDAELARTAVAVAVRHPRALELTVTDLKLLLAAPRVSAGTATLATELAAAHLAKAPAQEIVLAMLSHPSGGVRRMAWGVLAGQSGNISSPDWFPPLDRSLAEAMPAASATAGDLPLLLEAIAKLRTNHFDAAQQAIINDSSRPQPIRLKALAAMSRPGEALGADAFALLLRLVNGDASPTARVDAARFLARSRLSGEQIVALAPVLQTAGPVELRTLLPLVRSRNADATAGRVWAESLARSPGIGSIEESVIRTNFSSLPAELYEKIIGPAVRSVAEANDAKKRKLEQMTAAMGKARVGEGKKVFESSACIACHQVGKVGRAMGPDLSHIGKIRQPRDILESIFFPNATIARDYEAHVVETADGQSYTGTLKNDGAEGLVLMDLAGQEKTIPRAQIVGRSVMASSLMPAGLEQTFTEQQLLDLVAWLVSLR